MKLFSIVVSGVLSVVFVGVAVATAGGRTTAPPRVTICHRTDSTTNPWRRITVSGRAMAQPKSTAGRVLRAHLRHTGDAIVVGTGSCPAASATPTPTTIPAAKLAICHKTGSASNPYRRITVSSRAIANAQSQSGRTLRGHMRHVGDLILPGAASCPTGSPASKVVRLAAALEPVSGATGSGTADVTVWLGLQRLCFSLTVADLTDVTGAHIHRVSTGSIMVPLSAPTTGKSSGCVKADGALLKEIATTPSAFYVNVHTASYPAGQVSGKLAAKR